MSDLLTAWFGGRGGGGGAVCVCVYLINAGLCSAGGVYLINGGGGLSSVLD